MSSNIFYRVFLFKKKWVFYLFFFIFNFIEYKYNGSWNLKYREQKQKFFYGSSKKISKFIFFLLKRYIIRFSISISMTRKVNECHRMVRKWFPQKARNDMKSLMVNKHVSFIREYRFQYQGVSQIKYEGRIKIPSGESLKKG